MKFLQMSTFGNPTEVVEVVESDPPPPPAANEATVAVEYSAGPIAEYSTATVAGMGSGHSRRRRSGTKLLDALSPLEPRLKV